jgi:hypothetical protein
MGEVVNFDHSQCYATDTHTDTKKGRQWCRREGPASMRRDRDYPARMRGDRDA